MHIEIKNLPTNTSKDDVRELIGEMVEVSEIVLIDDEHNHAKIATIHVDMDREEVNAIAKDLDGRIWHGTQLDVYAPLFGED